MEALVDAGIQIATVLGAGGFGAAVLMFVTNWRRENREGSASATAEWREMNDARKEEIDDLRDRLRKTQDEADKLRDENRQLTTRLLKMEAEMEGLKRTIAQNGQTTVIELTKRPKGK